MSRREDILGALNGDGSDLSIDITNLESALCEQAVSWAYWAAEAEKLRTRREGIEWGLKKLEADLYIRLREESNESGAKMTEATLKANVTTYEEVVEFNEKHLDVCHQERQATILRDAYASRKDCLITLAASRRAEASMGGATGDVSERTKKVQRRLRQKGA